MYSPYNSQSLYSESVYTKKTLIDLEKQNGRIHLLEPSSKDLIFKMAEKIDLKNKPTDYRTAITGIWEANPIETAYFSAENIQIIQNAIKAKVYELSGERYILPNQNINNLKIIMRGIYLQYAEHSPVDMKGQIVKLNKLVLDYVVPNVYNEAIGYEKYLRDQSTLVVPLPLPQQHNRDYKQLELKPWT